MMSHLNLDEETLMQVKQSTPSRARFADEAGPSTAQIVPATPITPNTDTTTVTSPSLDDLYLDSFNFALSKIFSSSLMASLTTKDEILKEIRDCILTENKDRRSRCHHIYSHSGKICMSRMDVSASTTGWPFPMLSKMPTLTPFMQLILEHGK